MQTVLAGTLPVQGTEGTVGLRTKCPNIALQSQRVLEGFGPGPTCGLAMLKCRGRAELEWPGEREDGMLCCQRLANVWDEAWGFVGFFFTLLLTSLRMGAYVGRLGGPEDGFELWGWSGM
jgi:hypothetical protein